MLGSEVVNGFYDGCVTVYDPDHPDRDIETTMTAKEFLRQYEQKNKIAERLKREYEREHELIDAVRVSTNTDGMPHGSGTARATEDKAIRLADKAAAWKIAELDAIEIRQEVFDLIRDIPGVEGEVLYERYVCLRRWEDICVIVSYSWRGVHKVHARALRIVEERMNRA